MYLDTCRTNNNQTNAAVINMKKFLSMAVLFSVFGPMALGQTNYECIVDRVTGFHEDSATGDWNQTTFLPGERFSIVEIREDVYQADRIDDSRPWSAICLQRSGQSTDSFTCRQGTNEIHFNRKELRFISFRYFGYWNGSSDSVSMAIGKCGVS